MEDSGGAHTLVARGEVESLPLLAQETQVYSHGRSIRHRTRKYTYSHGRPISRKTCRYILTADQSGAGRAGIFSRQTNQEQDVQVYSHGRLITQARDSGGAPVLAARGEVDPLPLLAQQAQVYSHGRPIRRRTRRYILTADQSGAPVLVARGEVEVLLRLLVVRRLRLRRFVRASLSAPPGLETAPEGVDS
eukprot:4538408-Pyramimonas_sp.AAC.1